MIDFTFKFKIFSFFCLISLPFLSNAQNKFTMFSHNEDFRGKERTLQYIPLQEGFIESVNGNNLYTRALYGGPTLFRIETSDRPIFGAYHKKDNRNIRFFVSVHGKSLPLDSVNECVSRYRGGERSYILTDPAWGGGKIMMTVLASYDKEQGIWRIETKDMPKGSVLTVDACATTGVKLNRNGDLGADPKNAFAPHPERAELSSASLDISGSHKNLYVLYEDRKVTTSPQKELEKIFNDADKAREEISAGLEIVTPDPYFNTLGSSLAAASEGIWDGETYQHGAIGWRMPLSGWRGAYTGDFTGRHDRARRHFDAYAASQVKDVPPVIPHPTQDPDKALARAEKKWGTQMYSNGYICRNPGKNDVMHHYDMNLCYIDELLWHLNWTGDLEYARKVWPVLVSHLEWEKRNFDPDDDGLYDAYCCIWASDGLYYNSGGVTHSTAYNYRANAMAAKIAERLGYDPAPYLKEADKILDALNSELWMADKGVWAEFKDFMGHKRLHDHPALWTVYHAIDSDVANPFQAYAASRYVDGNIPHIPVTAKGLEDGGYATLSTTDWMPYVWSVNNVAFAEVLHTALAFWQAGRPDEASHLLKSVLLDGMYIGDSPGNIGQISFYDAARGESYRDFADPVGVMSRAVVQGLFGFSPYLLDERIVIRPGFPSDWDHASISHSDFALDFRRSNKIDTYKLDLRRDMLKAKTVDFVVNAPYSSLRSVRVNGKEVDWKQTPDAVGTPSISFTVPASEVNEIEIAWDGVPIKDAEKKSTMQMRDGFELVSAGDFSWWEELSPEVLDAPVEYGLEIITGKVYDPLDLSEYFNSSVTDIFRNEYLSPRSPYTTLSIPINGIGEWCHPLDSANIDDSGLRLAAGTIVTPQGVPFITPDKGDNIVFTSLFDNYPDSVCIPLSGNAKAIDMILAGSTNHMQAYMENARIVVKFADGSSETFSLIPPYNWVPIEQDYFIDGKAFKIDTPRPFRITLKDALISDNLEKDLGIEGVYGRRIDGGAGILLSIPLDPERTLSSMTFETISNDIVAGIMALTYVRE